MATASRMRWQRPCEHVRGSCPHCTGPNLDAGATGLRLTRRQPVDLNHDTHAMDDSGGRTGHRHLVAHPQALRPDRVAGADRHDRRRDAHLRPARPAAPAAHPAAP